MIYSCHGSVFTLTRAEWLDITTHARTFIGLARAYGVDVAGPDGTGQPVITGDEIELNGRGEDGFETFALSREPGGWEFCKTGLRPYDDVVGAVLLYASRRAPDAIAVDSDGDMDGADWSPARALLDRAGLGETPARRFPVNGAALDARAATVDTGAIRKRAMRAANWQRVTRGAPIDAEYNAIGRDALALADELDAARAVLAEMVALRECCEDATDARDMWMARAEAAEAERDSWERAARDANRAAVDAMVKADAAEAEVDRAIAVLATTTNEVTRLANEVARLRAENATIRGLLDGRSDASADAPRFRRARIRSTLSAGADDAPAT